MNKFAILLGRLGEQPWPPAADETVGRRIPRHSNEPHRFKLTGANSWITQDSVTESQRRSYAGWANPCSSFQQYLQILIFSKARWPTIRDRARICTSTSSATATTI